jgi:hypothetical protein
MQKIDIDVEFDMNTKINIGLKYDMLPNSSKDPKVSPIMKHWNKKRVGHTP